MNEGRRPLHGLHEVRVHGVPQEGGHGARHLELLREHGGPVGPEGDDHAAQSRFQIGEVLGQAQGGHDLGGRGDEKARLARHAVHAAAQSHDHLTEGAVVDVEHTLPQHLAHIDAEGVAVVEVIVEGRGQEIVGGGDGVEVAREVEVDLIHGHDLGEPSARAAPLHAKGGPDGRLAQRDDRLGADPPEGLAQADGHGRLAVARRRGRDRGDHDELAVGTIAPGLEGGQQDLGLRAAVGCPLLVGEAQLAGDVSDRSDRGRHPA